MTDLTAATIMFAVLCVGWLWCAGEPCEEECRCKFKSTGSTAECNWGQCECSERCEFKEKE